MYDFKNKTGLNRRKFFNLHVKNEKKTFCEFNVNIRQASNVEYGILID